MAKCTWEGCEAVGTVPQLDNEQMPWATLCEAHHRELEAALKTMKPAPVLGAWIKAMGGSKPAARRMTKR